MAEAPGNLLDVDSLVSGYGKKRVLDEVTLSVTKGEIVAVIGHNGAGKSTLLKTVFGMLPAWSGTVMLDGTRVDAPSPRLLLRAGVAYVPQGNLVFTDLTVRENLAMGSVTLANEAQLEQGIQRVLALFPALEPRLRQRAGSLSGGEKQMLSLASTLVLSPRLLLLDEPSLGLDPGLVNDTMQRIRQLSRDSGTAALIVEQKVREVLKIARRVYVLRNGQVSFSGPTESLADEARLREVYL